MPMFIKKPVVIEAIQLTKELAFRCLNEKQPGPFGLHVTGTWHPGRGTIDAAYVHVETLEGKMRGDLNDWIIKGVAGEFYPCKPDIFAATYEPVSGDETGEASAVEAMERT